MGITQQGIEGEQKLFKYLRDKGIEFFQADGIGLNQGNYCIYEVKYKSEPFMPPPFKGHGLGIRQVIARLKFQERTGMRCNFIVFDKTNDCIFSGWLDELDKGKHFDTKNGVRIYPLENFTLEQLGDRDSNSGGRNTEKPTS